MAPASSSSSCSLSLRAAAAAPVGSISGQPASQADSAESAQQVDQIPPPFTGPRRHQDEAGAGRACVRIRTCACACAQRAHCGEKRSESVRSATATSRVRQSRPETYRDGQTKSRRLSGQRNASEPVRFATIRSDFKLAIRERIAANRVRVCEAFGQLTQEFAEIRSNSPRENSTIRRQPARLQDRTTAVQQRRRRRFHLAHRTANLAL